MRKEQEEYFRKRRKTTKKKRYISNKLEKIAKSGKK